MYTIYSKKREEIIDGDEFLEVVLEMEKINSMPSGFNNNYSIRTTKEIGDVDVEIGIANSGLGREFYGSDRTLKITEYSERNNKEYECQYVFFMDDGIDGFIKETEKFYEERVLVKTIEYSFNGHGYTTGWSVKDHISGEIKSYNLIDFNPTELFRDDCEGISDDEAMDYLDLLRDDDLEGCFHFFDGFWYCDGRITEMSVYDFYNQEEYKEYDDYIEDGKKYTYVRKNDMNKNQLKQVDDFYKYN